MPFTWEITKGNLPAGLSLDPNTGVVSGIPTEELVYTSVTVKVSDGFSSSERELYFGSSPNEKPYTAGTLLDWYDPYGLLELSNGTAVSSWSDFGLRNKDIKQSVSSLMPSVSLTSGNLPTILSSGDDYLLSDGTVNHQPYKQTTLIIWAKPTVTNNNNRFLSLSSANSFGDSFGEIGQSAAGQAGTFTRFFKGSPVTSQSTIFSNDNFSLNNWYFYAVVINPDDSQGYKVRCYRDNGVAGSNVVTLEAYSTTLTDFTEVDSQFIGMLASFDSSSIVKNFFTGYAAGSHIYGSALTINQLQELRNNTNPQTRKAGYNVFTLESSGAGDTKTINLNGTARKIDWGDGTYTEGFLNDSISHTYNTKDFYNVTVYPWDHYFTGVDVNGQNVQRWLYIPEYSTNMDLRNNSLDVFQTSNILTQVYNYASAYNIRNGTLRLEGQNPTAIPNTDGQKAWYKLVNQYGWNVTADGPQPTLELLSFTISPSLNQVARIVLNGYVGQIDWGDGVVTNCFGYFNYFTFIHTYEQSYQNIVVSIIGEMTYFECSNNLNILNVISANPSLQTFYITSSSISSFNFTLPNLQELFLINCSISSLNLQQFPNLITLSLYNSPTVTSMTFGQFNLFQTIALVGCSINQSTIDSLLIGLAQTSSNNILELRLDRGSGLSGTNSAPSSTGLAAANTIACRGIIETFTIWNGTQNVNVECVNPSTTTTTSTTSTTTTEAPCINVVSAERINYSSSVCSNLYWSNTQLGPLGVPVYGTMSFTVEESSTLYYTINSNIQVYNGINLKLNNNTIRNFPGSTSFAFGQLNVSYNDLISVECYVQANSAISAGEINGTFNTVFLPTTTTLPPPETTVLSNISASVTGSVALPPNGTSTPFQIQFTAPDNTVSLGYASLTLALVATSNITPTTYLSIGLSFVQNPSESDWNDYEINSVGNVTAGTPFTATIPLSEEVTFVPRKPMSGVNYINIRSTRIFFPVVPTFSWCYNASANPSGIWTFDQYNNFSIGKGLFTINVYLQGSTTTTTSTTSTTTTTTPRPAISVLANSNWNYTQQNAQTIQISNQALSGNSCNLELGLSNSGTLYFNIFNNASGNNYISLFKNGESYGNSIAPGSNLTSSTPMQLGDRFEIVGNTLLDPSTPAGSFSGTLSTYPIPSLSFNGINFYNSIFASLQNENKEYSNYEVLDVFYMQFETTENIKIKSIKIKLDFIKNQNNLMQMSFSTNGIEWIGSTGKKTNDGMYEFDISNLNLSVNSINTLGIKNPLKDRQEILVYTNQTGNFNGIWRYIQALNLQGDPIFILNVEGETNG